MKHTFKVHTTQFTIQVPNDANYKQAASYMVEHGCTSQQAYDVLTTEYRVKQRESDIATLCAKKPRKPTISAGKRNFPKSYSPMSTRDYVHEYYQLNGSSAGTKQYNGDPAFESYDKKTIDAFFQPLSTRITPIEGEDTYEVME